MSEFSHSSTRELRQGCQREEQIFRNQRRRRNPAPCLELFRRAAGLGDAEAWDAFIAIYDPQVRQWVRRHLAKISCSQLLDEDDFVHEVWVRVMKRFQPAFFQSRQPWTMGQVMVYLMRMTMTTVSRMCRRERRLSEIARYLEVESMERIQAPAASGSPLPEGMTFEDVLALLKDEQERLVLTYRYVYDLPPRKIAQQFPDTFADVKAVQTVWNRIRGRLARQLRAKIDE